MQISIEAKKIKNRGMSTNGIGEKPDAVIPEINDTIAKFAFFLPLRTISLIPLILLNKLDFLFKSRINFSISSFQLYLQSFDY